MSNYMIGIVTFKRYDTLKILLNSLQRLQTCILIIDANEDIQLVDYKPNIIQYHNTIKGYTSVVHNKNIIIHNFIQSSYEYLFIIEDDIKILDVDIFEQYINISQKYNLPHMNFGGRPDNDSIVYNIDDLSIYEKLQGCFSFYTKKCLLQVGLMNPNLSQNCWEHVEHTARIHQLYNYQPQFYHFPDVKNSWHSILMQSTKTSIYNTTDIIQQEKRKMLKILGWKSLPYVSLKQFDINSLKNYK